MQIALLIMVLPTELVLPLRPSPQLLVPLTQMPQALVHLLLVVCRRHEQTLPGHLQVPPRPLPLGVLPMQTQRPMPLPRQPLQPTPIQHSLVRLMLPPCVLSVLA